MMLMYIVVALDKHPFRHWPQKLVKEQQSVISNSIPMQIHFH